jgi:hypothetical protein
VAGCAPPSDAFVSYKTHLRGPATQNFVGSLGDVLSCIMPLGAGGGPAVRPLDVLGLALDGRNPGFLRPDA